MRTGWPSVTATGFGAFADDTQAAEDAQQLAQDSANAGTSSSDPSVNAVTSFLSNLWGTVAAPIANTLVTQTIQNGIYGSPKGYITVQGKSIPYWVDGTNAFTLNPNGDKVPLPSGGATSSASAAAKAAAFTGSIPTWGWLAIGGGVLLVALLVMKR